MNSITDSKLTQVILDSKNSSKNIYANYNVKIA